MSTKILINDIFARASGDLDGAVKKKVLDFIVKLQSNPRARGLNVKMPEGATDRRVRTARVDDSWRAVLFKIPASDLYLLACVKPHDDAYTYAAQLTIQVNDVTGAFELLDREAIRRALERSPVPQQEDAPTPVPLLDGLDVETLRRFGLDDDVAQRALTITDGEQFEELCEALPEQEGYALLELWNRVDPDDVYADLFGDVQPGEIDTDDIVAALARPTRTLQFAVGTPEELQAALDGELAAWRVWLHPLQHRLAYHDGWNGPFRVTGGAGTGKTVTALHRAKYLAERERSAGAVGNTVLLATFTGNLSDALSAQLEELAGADVAASVNVTNLDSLAYHIIAGQRGPRLRIVADDDPDVRSAWRAAAAGSEWSAEFLSREWLEVVLAQGITDQAGYLNAARPGRGVALNRHKRLQVWKLLEGVEQELTVSGLRTHAQAASEAAEIVAQYPRLQYRHVVVDEAQDLHPAHWRLIRALVPCGPDDIFIVGDAHQRIYGRPLVLSRFGIRTQGRSRRLTVNYRTSKQILRWCLTVMKGAEIDDLEGESDTLAGSRSEFSGPAPQDLEVSTIAEENEFLVEQVKEWIAEGFEPESIGVLSRTRAAVDEAVSVLTEAQVSAAVIDRFDSAATPGVVQVMTMHRAKGLEFRCVAVTRLGADRFPVPGTVGRGPEERKIRLAQERALLYVAGSRSRERLTLLHAGPMASLNTQLTV